ncbi:hypothetical protein FIBSPDRAFT_19789 [Athelia psychrophila]|uniref:Uncharacterized protein n=1 Tax=Athelia psychrophila TaxID=1759441 RepID=A0A166UC87_9AGAM|nr:hypothetical protein FIBSPDRAFT_19789 [Fibularhizoctonia sp. CBS 109695]
MLLQALHFLRTPFAAPTPTHARATRAMLTFFSLAIASILCSACSSPYRHSGRVRKMENWGADAPIDHLLVTLAFQVLCILAKEPSIPKLCSRVLKTHGSVGVRFVCSPIGRVSSQRAGGD